MHVKVKDTVLVLSGKSAGKRGKVLSVEVDKERAIVEGVNIVKRHSRGNPRKGVKGGILEREAPIHVSNLMLVCPRCGLPTRARKQVSAEGARRRTCRRDGCAAQIDS
jgi:large subunit ribosomal protein L24